MLRKIKIKLALLNLVSLLIIFYLFHSIEYIISFQILIFWVLFQVAYN